MKKPRNWVIVLFGVAVLVVFVAIGAVIAVTAWFQQNLQVQESTEAEADTAFDEVRQRFGGRAPLIELRDGRPAYTSGRPDSSRPSTELRTLHVIAFDPRDRHLAKIAVPFWLLRLKASPIEFSAYASGLDDNGVQLRTEDIERYGAGIILDTTTPSGERVLLWAQ
jgi:hypothetical protein